jgi:hypothetical protein
VEGIVEQDERNEEAVRKFNQRLKAGGSEFEFPVGPDFPVGAANGLSHNSSYHAVNFKRYLYQDGEYVRGGYILLGHGALVGGERIDLQFLKLPLSEGIVDRQYSIFGALLFKDAIKRAPLSYGLGGGGLESPVIKMLKRSGYRLHPVPFRFRVLNAANFLRNIQVLRTTSMRRMALDGLSRVPLLPRALEFFQASKASAGLPDRGTSIEAVPCFGRWADELWEQSAGTYSFIAIRDATTLNWRLPPEDERLHRITLMRDGRIVGWAVVTDSRFNGHRQFGSMRVGAIVDALCRAGEESATMAAAVRYLRSRRVDLMVSNQCAALWNVALARNGFLAAGSNFILATSPQLTALISRNDPEFDRVQINRCDGDGPIHL